jgi:hypothetical protein
VQGRAAEGGAGYEVVGLVATRDLEAGEEATISYGAGAPLGEPAGLRPAGATSITIGHPPSAPPPILLAGMPNAVLLSAYGFVPPEPNRHDRLFLPASLPPLSGAAIKATLAVHRQQWAEQPALLEAALLSLPLSRGPPPPAAEEAAAAAAALAWLEETAAADFVTSLEEDEAALDRAAAAEAAAEASPPWLAPVLRYRLQRKQLWRVAAEVLRAHVAEQQEAGGAGDEAG